MAHALKMDVPDSTGKTNREQLEYVYDQSGVKPELLDEDIEISENEQQFLNLFWRIFRTRSNTDGGLTLNDIAGWSTSFEFKIAPIEIDYLIDLSQVVNEERAKLNKG